jgi:tetratricopeptide (TPR) repeat protein
MLEDYTPAIDAYIQAVDRDPRHAFAWLNLGKACYEIRKYADAGRAFHQGYQSAPKKDPSTLYYSAAAYLMADQPRRAVELFEKLTARHPKEVKPQWKEHYVNALLAAGSPKRALPLIRELAALYTGEKRVQWQEILLYQYLNLDMQAQALKFARHLTGENPAEPRWWKALAHIQLRGERIEEALAALTIYSYLVPLKEEEKKLLADLSLQAGIPVKAAPLYEACMEARPDGNLLKRLVNAYQQLGRPEEALVALDAHGDSIPGVGLIMLQGELLYALKRYGEAAVHFQKAAQIKGPHTGRARLMAGYTAWNMDALADSRQAFDKAKKYKAQKKAATAALKQLAKVVP